MPRIVSRVAMLAAALTAMLALAGPALAAPVESGAFPATVKHKFGQTTITTEPKRVVVVGLREQDALLALGVVPVGTTEWFGNHPGAIFPWAKKALGKAPVPKRLGFTDGIEIEKVAALRPDLIVAIYSGLAKKDYDKLSKLAPTIAQPRGQIDWGASWQDDITMVGAAVGRPKAAAALKAKSVALIAAAAKKHPEFKGQTGAVATPYEGIYVYAPADARSRFLTDLGFTFPKALRKIGGKDFGGQLAAEKIGLLDVGALIWFAGPGPAAKIKKNRLYATLNVHTQGRDIFIPEKGTLYEATSFLSVLSIPLLVDKLVPRIAAAADGNPATKA
ncbi:MAG TPA: ABC transporter substrate-binding protein [Solirubrobacteraceae bacterium]|nr:ABC transporter substrate-binding protein [Solirubrobacteraceae bacterium]